MMQKAWNATLVSAILSAGLLGAAQSATPSAPSAQLNSAPQTSASQNSASQTSTLKSYDAHTEPNARSRVNFSTPGVVAEVLVKEGDLVKRGDPLMKLDERQDRLLLSALKLEGDSHLKIEAAQADLEQKKVDLEKRKSNLRDGAGAKLEVDEGEVAVKVRVIQVQVEEMTRQQKELEASRQAVKVEQMTLNAPFDGIVEKIDLKLGETPEAQRFAVTVVNNSPLWVNVYLPTSVALKLKLGDELEVKYKDTGEAAKGKVIKLAPVADAASETREVRLEVANPEGLPSGLSVTVMAGGTGGGTKSASLR